MTNQKKINIWKNFHWDIIGPILNFDEDIVNPSLTAFYQNIIKPLLEDNSILDNDILIIQLKIETKKNYRSISMIQRLNIKNFNELYDIFLGFWNSSYGEYYKLNELDSIIYYYKIINQTYDIKPKVVRYEDSKLNRIKPYTHIISDINVPMTMDLYQWGNLIFDSESNIAIIQKFSSNIRYFVDIEDKYHNVKILINNDNILFKFRDTILSKNDLYHFKRELFNAQGEIRKTIIYKDNDIVFTSQSKKYPEIAKINYSSSAPPRFLTMDIETKTIESKMIPITVSIYDGKEKKSLFLLDFKSSEEMIKTSIIYLINKKYNLYKVFFHNFSNFDSVFILKHLVPLASKIIPIIRDGIIIELKCEFGINNPIKIFFRDSFLMLPASLYELAQNFDCGEKILFPYKFINREDINLDYSGEVPDISYFESQIEYDDYVLDKVYEEYKNSFKDKEWNLKKETIRYCESDVVILHKVISKFQKRIFNLFNVDILKHPTLPSLAFAIFRSNYLNNLKIPNLQGNVYDFISNGYTGGAVDLYIFRNKPDEKVYRYDVNSLYPYIMATKEMPIGDPIEFNGNIFESDIVNELKINYPEYFEDKPFGFFEVEVESPKEMNIPIIQKRIKIINKGYRTIAPLGKWTGVYQSNEIYNAMEWGYKFKVKRGFLFKKKIIFKDYIDFLYGIKKRSKKGSPDYIISKLLMNSLYGRFGMSTNLENHRIVKNDNFDKLVLSSEIDITDTLNLDNGYILISFFENEKSEKNEELLDSKVNVNIAIAASITAEARIHMSKFKLLNPYKVFYSDTDSIDLNKPLPNELVGNDLGQMKLEHIWKDVIYISNKAYIGVSDQKDKNGNFKIYSKIRGIKKYNLSFEELKTLLFKNKYLEVPQERWYKDRKSSTIIVDTISYQLKSNDNKRIPIFYKKNILIHTKPIVIEWDKIINMD
jgi:hypothetical protein